MKKILKSLTPVVTAILCSVALAASAQTQTSPSTAPAGHSQDAAAIPTSASSVGKIYCAGGNISLTATGHTDVTGDKYEWYKIDNSGHSIWVKEGVSGDNTYTETATDAGYYDYQLMITNAAGCSSPLTVINKVYVLPALTVNVPAPAPICTSTTAPTTLTFDTSTLPAGYNYAYQWYLGPDKITTPAGTAGPTYNVPSTTPTGSTPAVYKLQVSFALNPTCGQMSSDISVTIVAPPTLPTIGFN